MKNKSDLLSMDSLSIDVLENIFRYLSYQDLYQLKLAMPRIQELCDHYIINSIDFVFKDIYKSMNELNDRINCNQSDDGSDANQNLKFNERRKLLRSLNIMENFKINLELVLILMRPDLGNNITYLLMQIFDNSLDIINSARSNPFDLGALHLANLIAQSDVNDMLLINNDNMTNNAFVGVRIVDYLDSLRSVHYNINVDYLIKEKMCVINGYYYLRHSKLLFYLPDIPFIKTCSDRTLTETEQIALMKYLALLVNVHNRLIVKTEQTKRDLELSKRELLKSRDNLKERPVPYRYDYSRPVSDRTITGEHSTIINETYTNCEDCDHNNLLQGIKCTIHLECEIEEAPFQIARSYKSLMKELLEWKIDESNNLTENYNESYRFDLKLDINLSTKKPEILELQFNHSNDTQ